MLVGSRPMAQEQELVSVDDVHLNGAEDESDENDFVGVGIGDSS